MAPCKHCTQPHGQCIKRDEGSAFPEGRTLAARCTLQEFWIQLAYASSSTTSSIWQWPRDQEESCKFLYCCTEVSCDSLYWTLLMGQIDQISGLLLKFKKLLKTLRLQRKAGQLQAPIKSDPTESKLSVKDLAEAEESLVSYIQQRPFRDKMTFQKKGQPVKRSSRIYKLDPVQQNGILRVGGRPSKLAMPEETQHPAGLLNDCHLSSLRVTLIHILGGSLWNYNEAKNGWPTFESH